MLMSDDEKWEHFECSNAAYDGLYFVAVKTTGIVCRPSCRARLPLRKNVMFYDTCEEALRDGFRPCKRCRPDLLVYQPLAETAAQVKSLVEQYFTENDLLRKEMKKIGNSTNHLAWIFRKQYHMPLAEYRTRLRIDQAVAMLREPGHDIAEIAYACGFENLSVFYLAFKRRTGLAPGEYRRQYSHKEEQG